MDKTINNRFHTEIPLWFWTFFLASTLIACSQEHKHQQNTTNDHQKVVEKTILPVKQRKSEPKKVLAMGFQLPVGKPAGKGYYNAQPFGKNNHLGDDWNAVTGGNSDLGDPIYATANGLVTEVKDYAGGWGNVVRLAHTLDDGSQVESLYAHCDTMLVSVGQEIKKGTQIATIGNAGGIYLAHLHFEIRDSVGLPIGGGYSSDTAGYLDPTAYIEENRE